MYLWWNLFTLYLLTCLVTVTVDDSGLRCCVACYMYDPLSSAFNSLCLLSLLKRILICLHATFCVLILQCYVLYYPSHPIHSWDLCLLSNHGGILSFPNWTYGSNNKKNLFSQTQRTTVLQENSKTNSSQTEKHGDGVQNPICHRRYQWAADIALGS